VVAKIKASWQISFAGMNCTGEDKGSDGRLSSLEGGEMAKIKEVIASYLRHG
jgi:hypothetical protein